MKKLLYKMSGTLRRALSLLLIGASLLWSFPAFACGCGVIVFSVPGESGWGYGEDAPEQSYINYEKGIEKLVIGLEIKNRGRDAVLVIPIPAKPEAVVADILAESPKFSGYNVSDRAKENLSHIRDALIATQIYPFVPLLVKEMYSKDIGIMTGATLDLVAPEEVGVMVYQHIEKNGMIAEVLSAATSDALYQYLSQKGLRVEKDSIPVFRDYINDKFSFVVSWINPSSVVVSARGVLMTFPTEKMYYPLKPGSAYAGEGSVKVINIVGHVSPDVYKDIKDNTSVEYFYSYGATALKDFFTTDSEYKYTRIVIRAAPKDLTEDLYISSHAPLRIVSAMLIDLHPVLYGFMLLLIFAYIATFVVFRCVLRSGRDMRRIGKLSIASCFTLIGTIIGAFIFLKEKRVIFIVSFSLLFLGLVWGGTALISLHCV